VLNFAVPLMAVGFLLPNREWGVAGLQFITICFFVSALTAVISVNGLLKRSSWQVVLLFLIICIGTAAAGAWGLRVRLSPEW
jgi:hypothetical protein